jgi:DNA topoisomerase-1
LIIVESPSKAKTINKYLGRKFKVMASVGHVKDLPKSKLGIDLKHDFEPEYHVIKGKKEILSEIKKAAAEADQVYLAPDPDREGEAIAWHIAQEIKSKKKSENGRIHRVLFNEITERAIKKAMEHPGEIDLNKVNAQQARRVLDRIVGYKISPLLWEKVRRGLSAGRVQSVAVRLICERDREIAAFVPEEYWSLAARLRAKTPPPFLARLVQIGAEKVQIPNAERSRELVSLLQGREFVVSNVEKRERRQRPAAPFTTSKLQQDASRKLRFTAKRTMMLAQQLYEGIDLGDQGPVGLITYMRTDSTRVSQEAQGEAADAIRQRFGPEYLPETPNVYKSKKGAQEAHEAIRPTSVQHDPEVIKRYLTRDQYQLYKLIWSRFLASQMAPAILDVTRVDIAAGDFLFRATGTSVRFPGFTIVYTEEKEERAQPSASKEKRTDEKADEEESDEELGAIPPLEVGERLVLEELIPKQHFTQPPPRYNEALLIRDLEEKGIGRPSTYAAIISTIQDRKYVEKREGRFFATELGSVVNELLVLHFPDVLNVEFTSRMENELDGIEEGEKGWVQTVRDFYQIFDKRLSKAQVEMRDVKREEIPTEVSCEKCGRPMVIKWGRFGRFLACSGYPECKSTKEFVETEEGIKPVEPQSATDEICDKCGKPMVIKTGRFGRFLACSGYPECKSTRPIQIGVQCPEPGCGGFLVEKRTRRGKLFYSCSNYPKCKFALWDRPVPEACPQCSAPFLVQKREKDGSTYLLCRTEGCGYRKEKEEN